jgi:hypothetical protein
MFTTTVNTILQHQIVTAYRFIFDDIFRDMAVINIFSENFVTRHSTYDGAKQLSVTERRELT